MKILNFFVLAFFALLLVAVRAIPLSEPVAIQVIALEEGCARQGGICTHSDECNNPVHRGDLLCPSQAHLGVSCCYI